MLIREGTFFLTGGIVPPSMVRELFHVTACKMGLNRAEEVVYVGDGDRSLRKIKEEHFGEAKGKGTRKRKKIKKLLREGEVKEKLIGARKNH